MDKGSSSTKGKGAVRELLVVRRKTEIPKWRGPIKFIYLSKLWGKNCRTSRSPIPDLTPKTKTYKVGDNSGKTHTFSFNV